METTNNNLIFIKSAIIFYLYTQFNFVTTVIIVTTYTFLKFIGSITVESVETVHYEDTGIVNFIVNIYEVYKQNKELVACCLYYIVYITILLVKFINAYLSTLNPITILGITMPIWTQFISYAVQGVMMLYKMYKDCKRFKLF